VVSPQTPWGSPAAPTSMARAGTLALGEQSCSRARCYSCRGQTNPPRRFARRRSIPGLVFPVMHPQDNPPPQCRRLWDRGGCAPPDGISELAGQPSPQRAGSRGLQVYPSSAAAPSGSRDLVPVLGLLSPPRQHPTARGFGSFPQIPGPGALVVSAGPICRGRWDTGLLLPRGSCSRCLCFPVAGPAFLNWAEKH